MKAHDGPIWSKRVLSGWTFQNFRVGESTTTVLKTGNKPAFPQDEERGSDLNSDLCREEGWASKNTQWHPPPPENHGMGQRYSHKLKGKQQRDNVQKLLRALYQRALLDVQKAWCSKSNSWFSYLVTMWSETTHSTSEPAPSSVLKEIEKMTNEYFGGFLWDSDNICWVLGKCKGTLLQQHIHLNEILQSSNLDVFKIYFVGIFLKTLWKPAKKFIIQGETFCTYL